jgi:two-component system, cell cycle sensor histidine kinase and response regulator CckA
MDTPLPRPLCEIYELCDRYRSCERYKRFFQESPVGFVILDESGLILETNQSFCKMVKREDLVGTPFIDLLEESKQGAFLARYRAVLQKPFGKSIDVQLLANGGVIEVRLRPSTMTKVGEEDVHDLSLIAIDVTAEKKAEEAARSFEGQLHHALKMEAVGRLASGIAHDFNNLLTSIICNASMVLVEREANPAKEILRAAESAASLTRQLLTFSRRSPLEPKSIQPDDLVDGLYKMLSRLIGEDVEIKVRHGEDIWTVNVDPGQIEQVLANLVVNARDAMPKGGEIRIDTDNVKITEDQCQINPELVPGRYVRIQVADTGYGMTDEVKKHLFEPFFTTKPKGYGTGLGLAVSYGVVKQARGFIEVFSEERKGTTVGIYLPRCSGGVDPPSAGIIIELEGGTETILIVEDEPALLEMTARILGRLGYNILRASDGDEAVLLATEYKEKIDLLFSDMVLPSMGGLEIAEGVKKVHPETQVLFTSGYTKVSFSRDSLPNGVQASCLWKPYRPADLTRMIREALGPPSSR